MVLRPISNCLRYLYKDIFLEVHDEKKNKVKGHIYQDKLVTGSIYVIKYGFSRKSQKSGFLSSQTHAQACRYPAYDIRTTSFLNTPRMTKVCLGFHERVTCVLWCQCRSQSNVLLMQNQHREDQCMIIVHMFAWPEVTYDIVFYDFV